MTKGDKKAWYLGLDHDERISILVRMPSAVWRFVDFSASPQLPALQCYISGWVRDQPKRHCSRL